MARAAKAAGPFLDLAYFLNRGKALALYRNFIRASRGLGDLAARHETVAFVRADFERYRRETAPDRIRSLLALGHRQLKQLAQNNMLVGTDGAKWRGTRRGS